MIEEYVKSPKIKTHLDNDVLLGPKFQYFARSTVIGTWGYS
jgi:hypothetical protein